MLGSNSIEAYGFSASFTIASTTLTQFIVFLPKVTNTRTLAVNTLIPTAFQLKMNILKSVSNIFNHLNIHVYILGLRGFERKG